VNNLKLTGARGQQSSGRGIDGLKCVRCAVQNVWGRILARRSSSIPDAIPHELQIMLGYRSGGLVVLLAVVVTVQGELLFHSLRLHVWSLYT